MKEVKEVLGWTTVRSGHGGPRLQPEIAQDPVTEAANAIRGELNLYTIEEALAAVERVHMELRKKYRGT